MSLALPFPRPSAPVERAAPRRPFGMVPLDLAGMSWAGPDGPERFQPTDYQIYPQLAYLIACEGGWRGACDLADRARVGVRAVYRFIERLERSGAGRVDRNEHGWIADVTLEESPPAGRRTARIDRDTRVTLPRTARIDRDTRVTLPCHPCHTSVSPVSHSATIWNAPAELDPEEELKIGSESEVSREARPAPVPRPDPIRSDRLRSQESEKSPQPTHVAPPPPTFEDDADAAFDPPAAQLAAWRLQIADFRHGTAEGRSAAAAGLARFARATAARRKAAAVPAVVVVPAPVAPAPPPVAGGAPAPVVAPSPPSGRCTIETLFVRVANPDGFPDDDVVDEAAVRLHETLGDKDDVKPYRDVMEELRAGMVKLADVHEAMRCSRGPQARRRPATFFWAINRARPWAAKWTGGDC